MGAGPLDWIDGKPWGASVKRLGGTDRERRAEIDRTRNMINMHGDHYVTSADTIRKAKEAAGLNQQIAWRIRPNGNPRKMCVAIAV